MTVREPSPGLHDLRAGELVFDWNEDGLGRNSTLRRAKHAGALLLDETLRDGLQSPSVTDPALAGKLEFLRSSVALGVSELNLGYPASSTRTLEHATALARTIAAERLPVAAVCAARALPRDVSRILDVSSAAGVPVRAYVFLATSPIRTLVEGWNLEQLLRMAREAVAFAALRGLPVAFVLEDTTRSRPEALSELMRAALDAGADRLCLCDTTGCATPAAASRLVAFARAELARFGATETELDWHGHDDRGLALASSLAALDAGATRVHATALGVGERSGNAPLELLLANLALSGAPADLGSVVEYARVAARILDWPVSSKHPLVGRDAFRTATGTHGAAIAKARSAHGESLAGSLYNALPADQLGRVAEVCIGPFSGRANVEHWLRAHHLEATDARITRLLAAAKRSCHVLSDSELLSLIPEPSDTDHVEENPPSTPPWTEMTAK
jgi:2-isopropylmalate synthase